MQEDLAVVSGDGGPPLAQRRARLLPQRLGAGEKIGRDFAGLHEPVAGMEAMNRRGGEFAGLMFSAGGGLLRFAWGVTFDDRLDHHPKGPRSTIRPEPASGVPARRAANDVGLPGRDACLFTIRTYLYDCSSLRRHPGTASQLASAIASMTPESLAYKNLADSRRRIRRVAPEP